MLRSLFKILYWFSGLLLILLVYDMTSQFIKAAPAAAVSEKPGLVTIAVVITPQMADGSSWDIGKGADLVLCGKAGCYVSEGLDKPARFYAGSAGPLLLKKAGACRDVVQCVFRGVDLSRLEGGQAGNGSPYFQLVDVDYVSHTYLDKINDHAAMDCALDDGVIDCAAGVHRRHFSLWVMEEKLALTAGRAGLDQVLFKGLMSQRVSALAAGILPLRAEVRASAARFYKLLLGAAIPEGCLADVHFLTETFYVAGLAEATQRRAAALIRQFTASGSAEEIRDLVQRSPALYWAYVDIAKQLKAFSEAGSARQLDDGGDPAGLVLRKESEAGAGSALLYGWQVKSRAAAQLSQCRAKGAMAPLSDEGG